ncbi:polyprenol phosphomannose-dependent alpha 1,6 mannosyltransferase MptB [Nocardioides sp. KIGAM211]|uniref:Polyprenol phosphomannose-dependent alpha 1,6 mannosyltransferase MptB n=1 Tax=Nocardioides luti TaxID=2761101 RepID=A0A7X0RJ46_9ACTN|nr:polyprenol phosphomannose-dependent alpha 1,6 mannosyltransferase MptB [Nocardioides luti]
MRSPHTRPGVLGAVLILAGGLVTATLPADSWAAGLPLRLSAGGRLLGTVTVLVGLALLAAAWLRLWRAAVAGRVDVGDVRRAVAAWCVPLLLAPPLFSRDGWSYVAQGELTRIGLSPYVWGPGVLHGSLVDAVDPRWLPTATPYGPLPLLWGALAADLVRDPWLLVVAHRLLALAGLVLLARALPRLAGWSGASPAAVSALVLGCPLVLAHGVGGLHNDLLMVGLAATALVVAAERGWVAGAVVGGLAASVKVPGGLVCIGIAVLTLPTLAPLAQRVRRLLGVAAVSGATVVAAGVLTGVGTGWVEALGVPGTLDSALSVTSLLGHLVPGARAAGTGLALLLVAATALVARTGDRLTALRATAAALTATVVLSPVVHPWYALWCVPFLAVARLGPRGTALLAWACLVLGVAAPLGYVPAGIGLLAGGLAITGWTARTTATPQAAAPEREDVTGR